MTCLQHTAPKFVSPPAGFEDPTLVAVSDNVYFKNYNVPLQAHLALSDDPTEMMYVSLATCVTIATLNVCHRSHPRHVLP